MNYNKNNLSTASSLYLQQHKDNPIHWQEWDQGVLSYAKQQDKLVLVSVGYSTCYWCTVMAKDTFQDAQTAEFLNTHFVSIKIDKELRPDIDYYMMAFAIQSMGIGGWPLNVILTPDLKPILAVTYIPAKSDNPQVPTFAAVAQKALEHYQMHKDDIISYALPHIQLQPAQVGNIIGTIESQFDAINGGFGLAPKFPPHATMLFLLSIFSQENVKSLYIMLKKTLDTLSISGLHDHLDGGFFRYCVDSQWNIPHFEKMLYDQAWLLWSYSAAYKTLKEENYKKIGYKLVDFLANNFYKDNLFSAAQAADTNGQEGATYIWTINGLKNILTPQEFIEFARVYNIPEQANPDLPLHLIKTRQVFLDAIEEKLLQARKKRPQPLIDTKSITSWNALTGIGLLMAGRYLGHEQAMQTAHNVFNTLTTKHMQDDTVFHSSIDNNVQKGEFLEDYATMLLFSTFMAEENSDLMPLVQSLYNQIFKFKQNNVWFESLGTDFVAIPANLNDYAIPASNSIAQFALLRAQILLNLPVEPMAFNEALRCDFLNVAALLSNGGYHIIDTPNVIDWTHLPLNTIQRKGAQRKDCFNGICTEYGNEADLLNSLQK